MRIHIRALLDPQGDQELSSLPPAKRWLTVLLRILAVFAIIGACFLIVALLELLVAALVFPRSNPPVSVDRPPIISNAQNVKVTPNEKNGGKTITYQTTTDPTEVYSFYDTALLKDGWRVEGFCSEPHVTNTGMYFEWEQAGIDGCEGPGYTLQLTAVEISPVTTSVQLVIAHISPF